MKDKCKSCDLTNPHKSEARLHINSFLMGGLFTVLALILTFNPENISLWIVSQMVLAIPLILFASLSYAKVGYLEHGIWDHFGWWTNNLGYLLFFNSTGLMIAAFSSRIVALIYFALVLLLTVVYYIANIISHGKLKEHISKILFFLVITLAGGIYPIMTGLKS